MTIRNQTTALDVRTINETYRLTIKDKMIAIEVDNVFGASRAFATLAQCVVPYPEHEADGKAYIAYDLEINDEPAFKWRQLLIDPARHYLPLRLIRTVIDALAVTKHNVLHFHAVDSESFPLKLEGQP